MNLYTNEYSPGWFMWSCSCGVSVYGLRSQADASNGVTRHQADVHGVETVDFAAISHPPEGASRAETFGESTDV